MPRPSFTLLHLTDLHFGAAPAKGHYWNSEATELDLAPQNRRGLVGSLVRDLREQALRPDLVVVTGDLLDRGAADGVPMAVAFLGELCAALALPRRCVVLVPGNHDVSRDPDPARRYALFDTLWTEFYGAERAGFSPSTAPWERVSRFDLIADLGVEIIGFNSCEALDPAGNQEHGSVGIAQLDRAEALLEATKGRDLFRIAAVHHHLMRPAGVHRDDFSVMDDAELTLRWLARRRFQLVLHGHQHLDWQDVREIEGWWLATAGGASAGVASYGRRAWMLQLGYQAIVVDGPGVARRVRREYDPQAREWIAAGKGAAVQELHFGPRVAAPQLSAPRAEPDPPRASAPVDVFIMFAPRDRELRDELDTHLSALCHAGAIRLHYRDSTDLGAVEQDAIDAAVDSAEIFLVLVSADFLKSPYFGGPELKRALDRSRENAGRGPLVIPIYLRRCDWKQTALGALRGLPRDDLPIAPRDHDEHFAAVADALRATVQRLRKV